MYDSKIGHRAVGNKLLVNFIDVFGDTKSIRADAYKMWAQRLKKAGVLSCKEFDGRDVAQLALEYVGKAKYRRGAKASESPEVFDCSSLVKWCYGQFGLWLPRLAIEQRQWCEEIDPDDCGPPSSADGGEMRFPRAGGNLFVGDLIFTEGYKPKSRYWSNSKDRVGHVGIIGMRYDSSWPPTPYVVHASNGGVRSEELCDYLTGAVNVSYGRPVPGWWTSEGMWHVVTVPKHWEIENAGKLRWLLLQ